MLSIYLFWTLVYAASIKSTNHKMISDYNKIQEPEKDKKTFKGFSD